MRIESLTNLGKGIARIQLDQGEDEKEQTIQEESNNNSKKPWVVMISNVIPGELVKCRVFRNFKGHSEADLVSIVEASPHRVDEPKCPLFGVCGGCQYQHITLDHQRTWKTQQVQELMERIGDIHKDTITVLPAIGTSHEYNYRNKMTPHYDKPTKLLDQENSYQIREIGFKQQTNRRLVDVPYCHIMTPAINEKLIEMREEAHANAKIGNLRRPKKGATLLLRDACDEEGNTIVETDPNAYIFNTVHNVTFQVLAGNFFQNNPYMLPVMVDKVKEAIIHDVSGCTHLIDAYCGSGLFALTCAPEMETVVGIEVNSKAIEEATLTATKNNIHNVEFVAASAEAIFDSSSKVQNFPRYKTVVIIDPPRSGCSEEFLNQLYNYNPKRLVYMSCDPATQARDAKSILNDNDNGYKLLSVQPLDLFPQTRHIECLMVFERE